VGGPTSGSPGSSSSGDKASQGYQLFHLMLIALISLLVGAFIAKSAADIASTAADPNLSADL
jgi:hypothetical protein